MATMPDTTRVRHKQIVVSCEFIFFRIFYLIFTGNFVDSFRSFRLDYVCFWLAIAYNCLTDWRSIVFYICILVTLLCPPSLFPLQLATVAARLSASAPTDNTTRNSLNLVYKLLQRTVVPAR